MQPFILDLNTFEDPRGKLSVLEAEQLSAYSFLNFIYDVDELIELQNKPLNFPILIISLNEILQVKALNSKFALTPFNQALYLYEDTVFSLIDKVSKRSVLVVVLNKSDADLSYFFCNRIQYPNFLAKRFFLVYDVPENTIRGCHAHNSCSEIFFLLNGSVSVTVDSDSHVLSSSSSPIMIDKKIWSEQVYLGKDSITLVVANENYTKEGYISQKSF